MYLEIKKWKHRTIHKSFIVKSWDILKYAFKVCIQYGILKHKIPHILFCKENNTCVFDFIEKCKEMKKRLTYI